MKLFRKITLPFRRYNARLFVKRFAKMLQRFDKKLKAADYTRHERRRLKRVILENLDVAAQLLLKE